MEALTSPHQGHGGTIGKIKELQRFALTGQVIDATDVVVQQRATVSRLLRRLQDL